MSKNGMMVILSAPSGAGKDTVFKEISRTEVMYANPFRQQHESREQARQTALIITF